MKKTNIIGICISVGVLVALALIFVFAFSLNNVSYQLTAQFKDTSRSRLFASGVNTENLEEKMQQDADFKMGCNLLFTKFDKNIENIEQNNPYVKVEKIVRSFPNKMTVYYCEREPVALLESNESADLYYVVDSELKVLDVVTYDDIEEKYMSNLSATQAGYDLPIVRDYNENYTAEVGQKIDNTQLKTKIATVVVAAMSASEDTNALFEDLLSPCSTITFVDAENDDKRMTLVLDAANGHTVTATIFSVNEKYYSKISLFWRVYLSNLKNHDTSDSEVIVCEYKGDNPEYQGKIVVEDTTDNVIGS